MERLLFLATDGDAAAVRSMMTQLEERGRASLPAAVVEALRRVVVDTHCVDDGRIVDVMRRCQRDYGYTVCPHSATALAYHFHVWSVLSFTEFLLDLPSFSWIYRVFL